MKATVLVIALVLAGCGSEPSEQLQGEFLLVRINGQPLPYDHEGLGCCTYLSGSFAFTGTSYTAAITARNRNNELVFTVSETGTYSRSGNVLTFTRVSFDGQPLLLSAGNLSEDSLEVGVGGEGPGSPDQLIMVFLRSENTE